MQDDLSVNQSHASVMLSSTPVSMRQALKPTCAKVITNAELPTRPRSHRWSRSMWGSFRCSLGLSGPLEEAGGAWRAVYRTPSSRRCWRWEIGGERELLQKWWSTRWC
ncbi:hypothetical protein DSL92_04030 [Billgrantia gudaonensis]|uniref:Uncharacterized protein n=1 Tax=Billgrantia gudaonensis TaxID=376427 RepID=A0A3S0R576_9GAMM|nr:hypothetical protein DSL92_04030 [Halomonas gudaonensis]